MSEDDVTGYEAAEHSLGWWLEHGDRWPVQREPRRLTDASLRMALACLRYATMLEEDAPHAIRDAMTAMQTENRDPTAAEWAALNAQTIALLADLNAPKAST